MIPFTQYLRPDGRRVDIVIERPEPVVRMARILIDHGYAFEAEVLTNGLVSLTMVHPDEDHDLAIEVVMNNQSVPEAVDRLINKGAMIHGAKL